MVAHRGRRAPLWFLAAAVLLFTACVLVMFTPILGGGWLRARSFALHKAFVGLLTFLSQLVLQSLLWGAAGAPLVAPRERRLAPWISGFFSILISWVVARTFAWNHRDPDSEVVLSDVDWPIFACGITGALLGAVLARQASRATGHHPTRA